MTTYRFESAGELADHLATLVSEHGDMDVQSDVDGVRLDNVDIWVEDGTVVIA